MLETNSQFDLSVHRLIENLFFEPDAARGLRITPHANLRLEDANDLLVFEGWTTKLPKEKMEAGASGTAL